MPPNLTLQIITLLLAALPLNLGLIYLLKKFILKQDKNFANIDIIKTQATGILTQPEVTIRSIVYDDKRIDIQSQNQEIIIKENASIELMAKIINFCRYPKLAAQEKVIKQFLSHHNIHQEKFFREYRILDQLPVLETSKISSTVALETASEEIYAFCKGNPFTILNACRRILIDGKKIDLDPTLITKLKKKIKKQLDNGHKLVAFAYKGLPRKRYSKYENSFIENDLVFIGFIGLGHFVQNEIKPQIKELRRLGVEIYLDENENDKDTLAIAHDLKITKAPENLESEVFHNDQKLSIATILHRIVHHKTSEQNKIQIQKHTIKTKTLLISLLIPALLLQAPLPFTITFLILFEIINSGLQLSLESAPKQKNRLTTFQETLYLFLIAIFLNGLYFWQLARFGWEPSLAFSSEISQKAAIHTIITAFTISTIYLAHNHTKTKNLYLHLTSILAILITFYLSDFNFEIWKPALITLLFLIITPKIIRKYV